MSKLGFDIDGVLAGFSKGYEDLCIELTGENLFKVRFPDFQPTWHFPEFYGYSKELMDYKTGPVWTEIRNRPYFWYSLPDMPESQWFSAWYREHAREHDIYFITDRPGKTAKRQTEQWLAERDVLYPTVIISHGKGDAVSALGLDFYVDDKGENIQDVQKKAPKCTSVLLHRPYNEDVRVDRRVERLEEALALAGLTPAPVSQ